MIATLTLKGNSHQMLLSEMSVPGVEVPIEKLLSKTLGSLQKENSSKRRCKVAFVQRKCAVTSSVSVRFLCAAYNYNVIMQNLVCACRAAVSVARYVYAFRNYLFEFLQQSSTRLSAV